MTVMLHNLLTEHLLYVPFGLECIEKSKVTWKKNIKALVLVGAWA